MVDLDAIKGRQSDVQIGKKTYPKVNAFGSKDQKDIRDLIAEVERLTAEVSGLRKAVHGLVELASHKTESQIISEVGYPWCDLILALASSDSGKE